MASDAIWQLQKAVYARLSGDSTLMTLVSNNVYEYVPQDTSFPFVAIGGFSCSRDDTIINKNRCEVGFTIDVCSRERGNKKVLEIITNIQQLLHHANLAVSGHTLFYISYVNSFVTRVDDGLTYRGGINFKSLLQET